MELSKVYAVDGWLAKTLALSRFTRLDVHILQYLGSCIQESLEQDADVMHEIIILAVSVPNCVSYDIPASTEQHPCVMHW